MTTNPATIPAGPAEDPWAWAREVHDASEPSLDPARVVAVMVTHEAGGWLARTLVSLARLQPRPGRTIVVDTGSTDESRDLLAKAQGEGLIDDVVTTEATTPFADAANLGWREAHLGPEDWVWFLHDDCEPTRTSLGALLTEAARVPVPAGVVPALLRPRRRNRPDRIQEVGQSISITGSRLTASDPDEIDQQQYESQQVLGGSTAGLLVRGDVLERLGGLRPEVPHREGLDLCWRARDVGERVVTAPRATVHHRRAGFTGAREITHDEHPDAADRLAGMRLVASRSAHPTLAGIGLTMVCLGRILGLLIGRAPHDAAAEWRALTQFWGTRAITAELRASITGDHRHDGDALRPRLIGTLRGFISTRAGSVSSRLVDRRHSDTSIDELTGDDFSGAPARTRRLEIGALWLVLAAVGVAASVRLIGGGVESVQLLPTPHLGQLWSAWTHPEPGVPGAPAPWLLWAALGSTLAAGQPGLLLWLVLALASVVTARSGLALLDSVTDHIPGAPRSGPVLALSALWGLMVLWTGVVQRGAVPTLVIVITAGWFAQAVHRWSTSAHHGPAAWRAPAAAALVATVWVSVQPVTWLLVAMAAGLVVWQRPSAWRQALVPLVAPLVFLAGWWRRLADQPARLLTTADPMADPAGPVGGPLALLGVVSAHTGLPRWLVIGVGVLVWIVVVGALVVRAGALGRWARLAAIGSTVSIVIGAWLPRLALRLDGRSVNADGSAFLLIGLGGLLVCAVLVLDGAGARLVRTATVVLTVAAVAIGAGAIATGNRPASRTTSQLPSWVASLQEPPRSGRTLLIDERTRPVRWQVTDATRPAWGSGEYGGVLPGAAGDDLREIAGSIAADRPVDNLAARLAQAGVVAVWIRGNAAALNGVAGLQPTPQNSTTTVYAVTGLVSRAQVISGRSVVPVADDGVAAATTPRTLALAEPQDSRLRARVGGTSLRRADGTDWRQTFALPAGTSGGLTWGTAPAGLSIALELGVLAALLVLVAPVAAGREQAPLRSMAAPRRGTAS